MRAGAMKLTPTNIPELLPPKVSDFPQKPEKSLPG